jgi:hypothetical protein
MTKIGILKHGRQHSVHFEFENKSFEAFGTIEEKDDSTYCYLLDGVKSGQSIIFSDDLFIMATPELIDTLRKEIESEFEINVSNL